MAEHGVRGLERGDNQQHTHSANIHCGVLDDEALVAWCGNTIEGKREKERPKMERKSWFDKEKDYRVNKKLMVKRKDMM